MLISELLESGALWRATEKGPGARHGAISPTLAHAQSRTLEQEPLTEAAQGFLPQGLPVSAVHEWFLLREEKNCRGKGNPPPLSIITGAVCNTLANSYLPQKGPALVLWIGKSVWPTPHLLRQLGGSVNLLSRSLFVDPKDKKEKLWAIDTALRSAGVAAVIAECESLSCVLSKRFSLAAKQGGTTGFISRKVKDTQIPSAAMTRWSVKPLPASGNSPCWEVELIRSKGFHFSQTHWLVEVCHDGLPYEESSDRTPIKNIQPQEIPLTISSNMVDGPAANEQQLRRRERA